MGNSGKTKNDQVSWTEYLAEARKENVETAPDGWKCIREIAEEIGKSEAYAQHIANRAWRDGKLERGRWPRWTGTRYYPTYYYKMVEK